MDSKDIQVLKIDNMWLVIMKIMSTSVRKLSYQLSLSSKHKLVSAFLALVNKYILA